MRPIFVIADLHPAQQFEVLAPPAPAQLNDGCPVHRFPLVRKLFGLHVNLLHAWRKINKWRAARIFSLASKSFLHA